MLKIFDELKPFLEDVYNDISVRQYAKLISVSPPTASKLLNEFYSKGLLLMEKKGIYIYYRANRENSLLRDLARAYWKFLLGSLFKPIHKEFLFKPIILFGSLYKCENKKDSDVDLYIDINPKNINLYDIEKKLARRIQIHFNNESKNKELINNIKLGERIL